MGTATLLLERGLITPEQLEQALAEQRSTGDRLERILVRRSLVDAREVLRVVGEQFDMPVIDLHTRSIDRDTLDSLPAKLVYRQHCVPVARRPGVLTVATSDPFDLTHLDELKLLTNCAIEVVLADEDELRSFIRANYGVGTDTLDEMALADPSSSLKVDASSGASDEIEQAQEASVIKLVNDILLEAVRERATDVHIEPYERELNVRYRIDGVLQRANVPATINRFGAAIVSRLKIMAHLNIAEKRKPQDGRISIRQGRREYDLRMSVIPMLFGEGVVLRILDKDSALLPLESLGMPRTVLDVWERAITRPHGILLVTGPTGSGKSTTLYASLNRTVSDAIKVITIEDPVEYHVDGINQIQVNAKIGLSFADGLRSVLRHDPDVVMVGEIRDRETAETAIQASLTGHLVLSTLHTNDAPSAATRLIDMGVEPFLVASSVEAVLAQRLVRRVCAECGEPYTPTAEDCPPDLLKELMAEVQPGSAPTTLVHGKGCRNCRQTGYRGRLGVYELLSLGDRLRELVIERVSAPRLASEAKKDKMLCTLREDGVAKARAGLTTAQEVLRALAS